MHKICTWNSMHIICVQGKWHNDYCLGKWTICSALALQLVVFQSQAVAFWCEWSSLCAKTVGYVTANYKDLMPLHVVHIEFHQFIGYIMILYKVSWYEEKWPYCPALVYLCLDMHCADQGCNTQGIYAYGASLGRSFLGEGISVGWSPESRVLGDCPASLENVTYWNN